MMLNSKRFGCQALLNDLVLSTTTLQTIVTKSCVIADQSSADWINDPCCNFLRRWETPCHERAVQMLVPVAQINQDQVNSQCQSPVCISSFLEDYSRVVDDFQQCEVSQTELMEYTDEAFSNWRNSKTAFEIPECYSDSDCQIANQQYYSF